MKITNITVPKANVPHKQRLTSAQTDSLVIYLSDPAELLQIKAANIKDFLTSVHKYRTVIEFNEGPLLQTEEKWTGSSKGVLPVKWVYATSVSYF